MASCLHNEIRKLSTKLSNYDFHGTRQNTIVSWGKFQYLTMKHSATYNLVINLLRRYGIAAYALPCFPWLDLFTYNLVYLLEVTFIVWKALTT